MKESQLAKEVSDQRPEIFQPGNKLDAAIVDLNLADRKILLSVKEAQIKELTDEKYTTYSIKDIKKGDALNLKFKKYDIFLNTKSVVGVIFLIFILAALGFTIFRKGVKK